MQVGCIWATGGEIEGWDSGGAGWRDLEGEGEDF